MTKGLVELTPDRVGLGPMPDARCPMPDARCPMPDARCPMPDARCPMIVVQDGTTHHCEGIQFGLWQSLGVRFNLRSAGPLRWSTAIDVVCDQLF